MALAFGTLGIVFGDIGTSPIYAFRESFEHSELEVAPDTAYGVASVVFWSLIIVISLKYLFLVMRADNHGEGGILALTALVMPTPDRPMTKIGGAVITLGVFGTALLYGDGLITPAISVLSAVEGFEVATTAFADWVIPVSIAILIALFAVQRRGTAGIARVFSPIMVVWFTVLGALGLRADHRASRGAAGGVALIRRRAVRRPPVACLPGARLDLPRRHRWRGAVRRHGPLRAPRDPDLVVRLVLPGLLLNYFGQAALLADGARRGRQPVLRHGARLGRSSPLAILATMATVIASQALISGAFSLTVQAVQLDYLPRLAILHTSRHHIGQVYVPLVNWLLMIGCVGLVRHVPHVERPGRGVRHRRHDDDARSRR